MSNIIETAARAFENGLVGIYKKQVLKLLDHVIIYHFLKVSTLF